MNYNDFTNLGHVTDTLIHGTCHRLTTEEGYHIYLGGMYADEIYIDETTDVEADVVQSDRTCDDLNAEATAAIMQSMEAEMDDARPVAD